MRIIIDRELCRGHAQCMSEVPEVFDVDASGKLTLLDEHPPEALAARLAVAAEYCPTGAIRIEREPAAPTTGDEISR